MNPREYRYSKEHEWIKIGDDGVAVVGITDYAQEQLGDIVFVYVPDDISEVEQFKTFGEIESPKAVSELYSPLSGRVTEVNNELKDKPELVNEEPYDKGWLIKVAPTDSAELGNLMSAEEYEAMLSGLSEGT